MSAVSEHRPPNAADYGSRPPAATRWEKAGTAILRSVWPREETAWLAAAQLSLARRASRYIPLLVTPGAYAIAQSCAPWVGWQVRTIWWSSVALVAAFLYFASLRLDRRLPSMRKAADIRSWAIQQLSATGLFCCVWCAMSVFLWAPGVELDHMLIVLLLAASLAGSVALGSVHPATMAVVVLAHGGFLVVPLALSHSALDHTLAALGVIYVLSMSVQALVLHTSINRMLTLEHERSGLVEGLRLAKQEFDRERSRAVAAGRAKSQFLSNMNHELRTPMNAILGFSELIKQKSFGTAIDKYAEYANIIHKNPARKSTLTLIDDMLDLAKIEGGKMSLRESEVDLARLMSDMFEEFEGKAAEAQLSLLRKVDADLPRVFADERALRQILANLASNAVKFTPAEGCITLFARYENDGRIALGVDDTGFGIAEDDQLHVFERFGQRRHDVASIAKGTGLGLAIVKGFTEAHDGEVKLESILGAGTRVTAYLPADRVIPVAPHARKSATAG